MLGLIKKDLLMIKSNLKVLIIIFIIFSSTALKQNNDLSFFPILISIMLSISTFSYDEYNKWNSYAITLPNGRKNIIRAKYLSALLLSIMAVVLSIILLIIIQSTNHPINFTEITFKMIMSLFSIGLTISIMYPVLFKFGVEKGRIAIFIGIFAITVLMGLVIKKLKLSFSAHIIQSLASYYFIIIPSISVMVLLISYKISIYISSKKEY